MSLWRTSFWTSRAMTACCFAGCFSLIVAGETATSERVPAAVPNVAHLPNALQIHDKVISGGLPEDDAAFEELQKLGVKTIISVDGATPNVELAKKFGMRYVHLPHGYDGISSQRAEELAKAVRDLPGPIYLHCHHGKHRSPAAATVACIEAGLIQPENPEAILKTAGTSPNYRGLYLAVREAHPVAGDRLDALQIEFQETVEVPPMAEAMVQMEHLHDALKKLSSQKWVGPIEKPELSAAHKTLLLREQFAELLRTPEVQRQGAEFAMLLKQSEETCRELEAILLAASTEKPLDQAAAERAFAQITAQCSTCHQAYRDIPLNEKKHP